jgi:hypothetical protein
MQEKAPTLPKPMDHVDFTFGVLFSVSKRWGSGFMFNPYDTKFHESLAASFERLQQIKDESVIRPIFRIKPDRNHGDSMTAYSAVAQLRADGLLQARQGSVIFNFEEANSDRVISRYPLYDELLFDDLAVAFLSSYEAAGEI